MPPEMGGFVMKIKMCGMIRAEDIAAVNEIKPDYIGFVFAKKSRRCISKEKAAELRAALDSDVKAVGVFVNEDVKAVAEFLKCGIIDIAQLHGSEDNEYILSLKAMTDKPVIKAFRIQTEDDIMPVMESCADMVLLDAGAGDGKTFDWSLTGRVTRPYFLAGGLTPENAGEAVKALHPYGLDVSSGIETDGYKDRTKMAAFKAAAGKEEEK